MATTSKPLEVGHVITSPDFAFGWWKNILKERILVDGVTTSQTAEYGIDDNLRTQAAAITGDVPPKRVSVELGAHDVSRGSAEFVVERSEFEGGSSGGGMNGHDDRPDVWHIFARRLTPDGKFDPSGEIIEFYLDTGYSCHVPIDHITINRKMAMQFA